MEQIRPSVFFFSNAVFYSSFQRHTLPFLLFCEFFASLSSRRSSSPSLSSIGPSSSPSSFDFSLVLFPRLSLFSLILREPPPPKSKTQFRIWGELLLRRFRRDTPACGCWRASLRGETAPVSTWPGFVGLGLATRPLWSAGFSGATLAPATFSRRP